MSQLEVKSRQLQSISHLLGIIMLLIMGRKIGNNGIAYFAVAVETFTVFYLLMAKCIPDALGKLLRGRIAKDQHQNAKRMYIAALVVQGTLGVLGAALLVIFADYLAESVFQVAYGAFATRLLAPVLLIRIFVSVLMGELQGYGSQMPKIVGSYLRQILVIVFGIFIVPLFMGYGERVSKLLLNNNIPAMYGAAGLAVAMIAAELVVLIFLGVAAFTTREERAIAKEEAYNRTESFGSAIRTLYISMFFVIIMELLARLPVISGYLFYQKKAEDTVMSVWDYGVFYGGYMPLCAFFILLGSIFLLPVAARVASGIRRTEPRFTRDMFGIGIHLGLFYALFPTVFVTVMAAQIAQAFGTGNVELLTKLLQTGSFIILEAVLAIFFVRALMNTSKILFAVGAEGISFVVFILGAMIFVNGMELGVAGLLYAGLAGCAVLCILTGVILFMQFGCKINLLKSVLIPIGSALLTGVLCLLLAGLMTEALGNVGTVLVCLMIGITVYLVPQLLLGSFREPELRLIPGGKILRKLQAMSPLRN